MDRQADAHTDTPEQMMTKWWWKTNIEHIGKKNIGSGKSGKFSPFIPGSFMKSSFIDDEHIFLIFETV